MVNISVISFILFCSFCNGLQNITHHNLRSLPIVRNLISSVISPSVPPTKSPVPPTKSPVSNLKTPSTPTNPESVSKSVLNPVTKPPLNIPPIGTSGGGSIPKNGILKSHKKS